MKTLILLRHGKSDWSGSVPDIERPINHRGRLAAEQMAAWMAGEGLVPKRMLVSPATRTQETSARLRETWGKIDSPTIDALYLAEPDAILDAIRAQGKGETLLVLGHNPGLERMAVQMSRDACPAAMPTCAAAILRFDATRWSDVGFGEGALLHHVTPKSLD